MPEQTDRFDSELDAALASYAQTSGIEGLEERVLYAASRQTKTSGMITSLPWAAMVSVAVVICWLLWQQQPVTKQLTAKQSITVATLPLLSSPSRRIAITLTHVTKPRRPRKNLTEPKLPRFPSPSPMTGEERALLRLAASGRAHISQELAGGGPIQPIQMKALEIKPLN